MSRACFREGFPPRLFNPCSKTLILAAQEWCTMYVKGNARTKLVFHKDNSLSFDHVCASRTLVTFCHYCSQLDDLQISIPDERNRAPVLKQEINLS